MLECNWNVKIAVQYLNTNFGLHVQYELYWVPTFKPKSTATQVLMVEAAALTYGNYRKIYFNGANRIFDFSLLT